MHDHVTYVTMVSRNERTPDEVLEGRTAMITIHTSEREFAFTHRPNWRDRAACRTRQVDPELFFPVSYEGVIMEAQVAAAKVVCYTCPVAAQCLEWALAAGVDDGVWGAHTPDERRDVLRTRAVVRGRRRPRATFVDPDDALGA